MRYRTSAIWPSLLALALAACNSSATSGPSSKVEIQKITKDNQTAISGTALDVTVRVRKDGAPYPNARVSFSVIKGGGALSETSVVTGTNGEASTLWLLGYPAGEQVLRAKVDRDSVLFTATATKPQAGKSYYGRKSYIEYRPGDLPIILSAPHGGDQTPSEIADRTWGTIGRDTNTRELTVEVSNAFQSLTGKRPHIIINHLHRRKLDANREIVEAAQGDPYSERAWYEFQHFIDTARKIVELDHGRGFYIDMHGHGHEIPRLELGYLLTSTELAQSDAVLNQAAMINKSSIRTLATQSNLTFSQLLRGPNSFGDMLVRRGYPAVPSSSDPHPNGQPYFNGGYNTGRHGSRSGGKIDGLQIEHHSAGVRNTAAARQAYARALAETLIEYLDVHMGIKLVK